MPTAESPQAQPTALPHVLAAVARVLGIDAAGLRGDTPLAPLGWDSLAAVCWHDAMAAEGWGCDVAQGSPATIADLASMAYVIGARP